MWLSVRALANIKAPEQCDFLASTESHSDWNDGLNYSHSRDKTPTMGQPRRCALPGSTCTRNLQPDITLQETEGQSCQVNNLSQRCKIKAQVYNQGLAVHNGAFL